MDGIQSKTFVYLKIKKWYKLNGQFKIENKASWVKWREWGFFW